MSSSSALRELKMEGWREGDGEMTERRDGEMEGWREEDEVCVCMLVCNDH